MSASRLFRILISIVVIGGAAIVLYPRIFSQVRSNGTINARVVTVQAPIGGTIVREFPDVGSVVDESTILTRIVDDRESTGLVGSLKLERDYLRTKVEALQNRLGRAMAQAADLEERVRGHAEVRTENITFQIREATARREFWRAVQDERTKALGRTQELVQKGAVSTARLDEIRSEQIQAREEVNRAQADLDRYTGELDAARQGIFIGDGQNDVPYSQQRLDEVQVRTADLELELAEAHGRMDAVREQLNVEETRAQLRESAYVRSPVKGIIWRRLMAINTTVTQNNDLVKILDCSSVVVEIAIPEETSETLDIGDPVHVRLQGSDTHYTAKVSEIRGTRSVAPGIEYAAMPPLLKKDELLLVAEFAPENLYDVPESFCDVGRRAEVTIKDSLISAHEDK